MGLLSTRRRGDLRHWDVPWDLQHELDRFFNGFGEDIGYFPKQFTPATDVMETDDAFIVEADIPGMKKEDVHIEVADNVLTIKGERKSEHEEKRKDYHRVERRHGSFRRTVSIPGGIKRDDVEAKFEDGVLTVTLPKLDEAKPRRIDVKVK